VWDLRCLALAQGLCTKGRTLVEKDEATTLNYKDIRLNQIHCHQGDLKTGTRDWVEANTLDRAREIKEEQLINIIKVTIKKEEGYMVLSLGDKKNKPKPINRH
jgi:hypothetical protein